MSSATTAVSGSHRVLLHHAAVLRFLGVVDIRLIHTLARLGCAFCAVTHVGRHFLRIELGYRTSAVQDVLPNAVEDRSTTACLVILVHELQSVQGNLPKLTSQLQLFYFILSSQPLAGLYHKPEKGRLMWRIQYYISPGCHIWLFEYRIFPARDHSK